MFRGTKQKNYKTNCTLSKPKIRTFAHEVDKLDITIKYRPLTNRHVLYHL